jgi:uncharacterized protein (TIGR00369 family)
MIESLRALKSSGRFTAINSLVPYAQFIGLEVELNATGVISVLRNLRSNIGNTHIPAVHGGVVGAALEHAAIIELCYVLELDSMPRVINVSIDFLRPVLAQDLYLQGEIVRHGRRIANVRTTAWQDDPAKLVATAHANFKLAD